MYSNAVPHEPRIEQRRQCRSGRQLPDQPPTTPSRGHRRKEFLVARCPAGLANWTNEIPAARPSFEPQLDLFYLVREMHHHSALRSLIDTVGEVRALIPRRGLSARPILRLMKGRPTPTADHL